MSGAWIRRQVACLAGSVLLVIGPFMKWETMETLNFSGMRKTANDALILVAVGIIGAILALVSLLVKRSLLSLVSLVLGLVGLGMSAYYFYALLHDVSLDKIVHYGGAHVGAGIYVCLVGSALVVIGALASGLKLKRD